MRNDKDSNDSKEVYVGNDCDKYKGILKLRYPVKNGVFQNEQDILTVFNHIYSKLEIKSEEIKEHPILITEPILNPYNHRRQVASVLFDNFSVPALCFGSQPVLSLFASGNKSGVVLESGEGVTQCCVVYEGYSIPHSYMRQDFAGRQVTEYFQTLLKRVGYSFNTTAEIEIVKKLKESSCYNIISSNTSDEDKKKSETAPTMHTLPDGTIINLKEEKVMAPEILFNPSIVGTEFLSFPEIITTCLSKVDIDIRAPLYQNIILAGGNTLFKGLPEKLGSEVKKLAPKHMKVRLLTPTVRKNSSWYGGSIITSLGSFKNMWITRNEYLEKGDRELFIKTI